MNIPLRDKHLQEWLASGVDEEIIRLNVKSLEGAQAYEYLIFSDDIPRRRTGRLTDYWLNKYRHIEEGGFWCSGINLLTGQDDLFGCYKPDKPRRDKEDRKLIKYEYPPRYPISIFALKVSLRAWERVSRRYKVAMPEQILVGGDGEAIGFWAWVLGNPKIPVVITEGAKKAGRLLSNGYAAIALPGASCGFRSPKDGGGACLIPELKLLAHGRVVYLAFDQDAKRSTVRKVNAWIRKTGLLLKKEEGCQVRVITWNPKLGKGCDDILPEAFDTAYLKAKNFDTWKALGYSQLTYEPNVLLNQRWLSDGLTKIPTEPKIVGIKSAKNTGKTTGIEPRVSDALSKGQRVLVIGHRIQLVEALCKNKFGIDYITEIRDSETRGILGYGLCIDSLHPKSQGRFNPDEWSDSLVIIDEADQVVWHGLEADTCQAQRVSILRSLKALLKGVAQGEGQIILADADLSDATIDFVRQLAEIPDPPYLVVNDWTPGEDERWQVSAFSGSNPAQLVNDLMSHIREGGKPFVCLSAQKEKSPWGTQNLERRLGDEFPDKRILRIDSETVSDPQHPAYGCISKLNQVLSTYDIVLASPAIETGVSIDIKGHFTSVWAIAQGVQPVNSVLQQLIRVRENVPRYIWIAKQGIGKAGNGTTNHKALLGSEDRLTKYNIERLRSFDLEVSDTEEFLQPALTCWAKMAARVNAGMANYRASVLDALREEGHRVIEVEAIDPDELKAIKAEVVETRDANYLAERQASSSVELVEESEFKELDKKRARTKAERRKHRKYLLHKRYGGVEVTPELIYQDDKGWYQEIRLHYFLTIGRDYLPIRDKRKAAALAEEGLGQVWRPDFNRSQLGAKIAALDKLGITALIEQDGRLLRNSDEDVQQIAKLARSNPQQIRDIFRCSFREDESDISVVKRLLGKVGVGTRRIKREGPRDNRQYVYQLAIPADGRSEVFQRWVEHDQKKAEEQLVSTLGNKELLLKPHEDTKPEPPIQTEENGRQAARGYSVGDTVRVLGGWLAGELGRVTEVSQLGTQLGVEILSGGFQILSTRAVEVVYA